jgi:hypothetical protein
VKIANMSEAERENLKFMLEKLGPKKKWKISEINY